MDAIYLISGVDGQTLWRLGGKHSDFDQDFHFSRQHDARVRSENSTTMEISFLENGFNGTHISNATAETSSLLVVALDLVSSPMRAKLQQRYLRPDKKQSFARGNAQMLGNGNILGGWGDAAYISEHTSDGEVVRGTQHGESGATYLRSARTYLHLTLYTPATTNILISQ